MYEEFYGLTEKPFSIQPDPSFLYWGRGHRLAYAMLEYGVVNQAGISVVTGEVGCGKTTLIHRLLDQLSDTHTIALLSNIQPGRGDLLSWVLMGFGEPYAGKTHVEMFSQLQSFFIREYAKGKRVVLIIDEAQNLSIDMLEEIRMLSNINAGKDQLLQLILVGQPQLKDLLSRPDMLQLAQRIGSDFHLTPLNREEAHGYLETRLSIAGAKRNIFTKEAMDLIAEQSRGVPRVINIIADTALVYGFSAQEERVDADIIRSVIRDKQEYGVFGVPNSPELKLSETSGRRQPESGFLNEGRAGKSRMAAAEEKERAAAEATPRQLREQPRLVSNLGVRFVAEPAEIDIARRADQGRPVAYDEPVVKAEISRSPSATLAPARVEQPPAEIRRPEAAPARADIGVVVICVKGDAVASARSASSGRPLVAVVQTGSPNIAALREAGIDHVELDAANFSGGRARNAGYRRLKKLAPSIQFVQFVESGYLLDADWLATATQFMIRRPEVAALEGGIRPAQLDDRSLFDFAVERDENADGEVQAATPIAMFRTDAFEVAGGFRGDIVADETADLCIRLRRRGAHVWRSEEPMAISLSKRLNFAGWRALAREKGFACAAGAALHGGPPERYCVTAQARAVMWGAVLPALILVAAIIGGSAASLLSIGLNPFAVALSVLAVGGLIYCLKIAYSAARTGIFKPESWVVAAVRLFGHFYECGGVAQYWFGSRKNAPSRKAGS